ncbi:Hypothetical predicted protein, partial [Marmota monax]
ILSFNNLTWLDEKSLAKLGSLSILHLSHNSISHIAEAPSRDSKTCTSCTAFTVGVTERRGPGQESRRGQSRPPEGLSGSSLNSTPNGFG